LGEGHRQILIPAGEVLCVLVPAITSDALVKFLAEQMLDQLRKHGAARVHPALLPLPPSPPSSVSNLNEFMLGSDKSRGYCLEMICADFLPGAHVGGKYLHFL
jgi:hypothetical protein